MKVVTINMGITIYITFVLSKKIGKHSWLTCYMYMHESIYPMQIYYSKYGKLKSSLVVRTKLVINYNVLLHLPLSIVVKIFFCKWKIPYLPSIIRDLEDGIRSRWKMANACFELRPINISSFLDVINGIYICMHGITPSLYAKL